ncbi:3'-5' ssDNA/RNA exonuclease TatD [Candidatus Erwinia haradaeae]|uniref:3'-5' ssDNA/RNA exonuclease TatD n=1 Tax=Candidatus Erwinia haradaeae TaxID=1922217 RepID=A0A451DJK3_9GAMM|nr:TatD family hydrolase [Candidatus Erwinia haradaeae]VFP86896.1 3'-5' ssDNA/RNA exonuclease TatD [Candidatus Erwinia haradaeae]
MFDIGVNLTSPKFLQDYDEVVQRARAAGVTGIIIIGTTMSSSRQGIILAKKNVEFFWCTVGLHPHHANTWSKKIDSEIRKLAVNPHIVAIGECGLDFYRNFSTKKEQMYAFQAQIELAIELNMPVFLHCRDAHKDFMSILKPWIPDLKAALVHCFTGTRSELEVYFEHDMYIGITGWICDQARGSDLCKLIPLIPSNRLVIETDAPWLIPKDLYPLPPSRRNEPSFLPHIMKKVAMLRGDDFLNLSNQTTCNARKLFNLT